MMRTASATGAMPTVSLATDLPRTALPANYRQFSRLRTKPVRRAVSAFWFTAPTLCATRVTATAKPALP